MIISVKRIAAAVILGICAFSMSGVMAQQPTAPLVRVIEFKGDFTSVLAALPNVYGVTVGLDKIAQESRIEIWIFRNYPNGFFSISSVDR